MSNHNSLDSAVEALGRYLLGPQCRGALEAAWNRLGVSTAAQHERFAQHLLGEVGEDFVGGVVGRSVAAFIAEERAAEAVAAAEVEALFRACVALSRRVDEPLAGSVAVGIPPAEEGLAVSVAAVAEAVEAAMRARGIADADMTSFWEWDGGDSVGCSKRRRLEGGHSDSGEKGSSFPMGGNQHPIALLRAVLSFASSGPSPLSGGKEAVVDSLSAAAVAALPFVRLPITEQSALLQAELRRLRRIAADRLRLIEIIDSEGAIASLPVGQQAPARAAAAEERQRRRSGVVVGSGVAPSVGSGGSGGSAALLMGTSFHTALSQSQPQSRRGSAFQRPDSVRSSSAAGAAIAGRDKNTTTTRRSASGGMSAGGDRRASKRSRASATNTVPPTAAADGVASSNPALAAGYDADEAIRFVPILSGVDISSDLGAVVVPLAEALRRDLSLRCINDAAEELCERLRGLRQEMVAATEEALGELAALDSTGAGAAADDALPISAECQFAAEIRTVLAKCEADATAAVTANDVDGDNASGALLSLPKPVARLLAAGAALPTAALAAAAEELERRRALLYDAALLSFAEQEEAVVASYKRYYAITGDEAFSKVPSYASLLTATSPAAVAFTRSVTQGGPPSSYHQQRHHEPKHEVDELNSRLDRSNGGNGRSMWLAAGSTTTTPVKTNKCTVGGQEEDEAAVVQRTEGGRVLGSCSSEVPFAVVAAADPSSSLSEGGDGAYGNGGGDVAEVAAAACEAAHVPPPIVCPSSSSAGLSGGPRASAGTPFDARQSALRAAFADRMRRVATAVGRCDADAAAVGERLRLASALASAVEERESLLTAMRDVAAASREMLLSRSASMAQALKRDGAVRRRAAVRMPLLVSEIVRLCDEWERCTGRRAVLGGADVLAAVTGGGAEGQPQQQQRRGGVSPTPLSRTPSKGGGGSAPATAGGLAAAGNRGERPKNQEASNASAAARATPTRSPRAVSLSTSVSNSRSATAAVGGVAQSVAAGSAPRKIAAAYVATRGLQHNGTAPTSSRGGAAAVGTPRRDVAGETALAGKGGRIVGVGHSPAARGLRRGDAGATVGGASEADGGLESIRSPPTMATVTTAHLPASALSLPPTHRQEERTMRSVSRSAAAATSGAGRLGGARNVVAPARRAATPAQQGGGDGAAPQPASSNIVRRAQPPVARSLGGGGAGRA